jgi:predicted small lipoprotein YifL
MKKLLASVFATVVAASLTACGGGGGEPPPAQVAAATTTIPATATSTAIATGVPFTFAAGVPDFGTTATTTLAFTDTSTTPAFSISSGGNTASGTTTFGSCHFKILASTFPSTSKMGAIGSVIDVNPCNLQADTSGLPANATAEQKALALVLGTAASSGTPVTMSVNQGGQLTINGKSAGTVTLQVVTG